MIVKYLVLSVVFAASVMTFLSIAKADQLETSSAKSAGLELAQKMDQVVKEKCTSPVGVELREKIESLLSRLK